MRRKILIAGTAALALAALVAAYYTLRGTFGASTDTDAPAPMEQSASTQETAEPIEPADPIETAETAPSPDPAPVPPAYTQETYPAALEEAVNEYIQYGEEILRRFSSLPDAKKFGESFVKIGEEVRRRAAELQEQETPLQERIDALRAHYKEAHRKNRSLLSIHVAQMAKDPNIDIDTLRLYDELNEHIRMPGPQKLRAVLEIKHGF